MFCPKCGAQNPDGSPFCASCGAQMAQQPQPQQPMNQGAPTSFNNQVGNAFKSADLDPKNMINDFVAFFKKPTATIQQIIAWAGALLLFISTLLPHLKMSIDVSLFGQKMSESQSWNLYGSRNAFYWLLFLLFFFAALFFTTIKRDICVLAVGGASTLLSLLNIITISKSNVDKTGMTAMSKAMFDEYMKVSRGIGCWFILIASLAILAAGVWGFLEAKKKN